VIRILVVVDDDPPVCAHPRTILGTADGMEVVGESHDGVARSTPLPGTSPRPSR
jgi:DNA-binding NarL/FixJ family response regulator